MVKSRALGLTRGPPHAKKAVSVLASTLPVKHREWIGLQDNGVQTEAWAPFAEGRNHIFENPTLRAIATRYQRAVAQVINVLFRVQCCVRSSAFRLKASQ